MPRVAGSARAIALLVASRFIITLNDANVKHLDGRGYPPALMLWTRNVVTSCIILPLALRSHGARETLRPPRQPLLVLRGVLQGAATLCFYVALGGLPLADAGAMLFVAPILIVVASAVATRERVSPGRWAAVLVGFASVLAIAKPFGAGFKPATLLALLAAAFVAAYTLCTRALRASAALVVLLYQSLPVTLAATALLPSFFVLPTRAVDGLLMASLGVVGAGAHQSHTTVHSSHCVQCSVHH